MLLLMIFAAVISVTQLAALGSWARSLRLTTLLQGIAVGFLVCGSVTVALQFTWTRLFAAITSIPVSDVQNFASWTVDPFIEEILKVAPLVLLMWLRPRVQRQLGYTDHLLYGAALGIGFEVLEAALRYTRLGFTATNLGDRYIVRGGLFGLVTVPNPWTALFTWQPVPAGTEEFFGGGGDSIQHLVWTALAAVGIAWFARRTDRLRFLGLAPLLLAALDHANYNLRVQSSPPIAGWWSDALAWIGLQLPWVLVLVLAAAVAADRMIQARGRLDSPAILLAKESSNGLNPVPVLRSAMAGLPWSAWVTWQVVLSRRAAMTALTTGEPSPHLHETVAHNVALLRRMQELPRAAATALWQKSVKRLWTGLNLAALRSPIMILWGVAMLPAVVYLFIGAFPATKILQQAMNSSVGLWLMVLALMVGGVLTAMQLKSMVEALRSVTEPSLHERRLRLQARLATAVASLGGATVMLAVALIQRDPGASIVRTYHVLDAISDAIVLLGLALMLASFFMFPPVAMMAIAGGGMMLVPTAAAGTFAVALSAGAILTSLGVLMNESASSSGASSGGGGPPRYTSNSGGVTRTYGNSVNDITGQAKTWGSRMQAKGFDVRVPPVRYGKYGFADVTVTAMKNGKTLIRHFIYRG